MKFFRVSLIFILLGFICLSYSCNRNKSEPSEKPTKTKPVQTNKQETNGRYFETGDFAKLQKKGKIRILVPRKLRAQFLPRNGLAVDVYKDLADEFVQSIGLKTEWIYVESYAKLIPMLLEGRGDLVVANLTATEKRRTKVTFSVPLEIVKEQIITRKTDNSISSLADLRNRTVALRKSSSYYETLKPHLKNYPEIKIQWVPEHLDTEEILYRVSTGTYDVTIADSNYVDSFLTYSKGIKVAFDLKTDSPIAWAVRPQNKELLGKLNHFIHSVGLSIPSKEIFKDDLNEIKKRKILRVITRNSATTYFIWRGELLGFEYELVRKFAAEHGIKIELIVPPTRDSLLEWLHEGRGDIVAAALTVNDDRLSDKRFAYSRPYNEVTEMVVTRKIDNTLQSLKDLAGRSIFVRKSSSYWHRLEEIRKNGIDLKLIAAPEHLETEEIIAKVASAEYDLTVADSHIVDVEMAWRNDIKEAFALGEPVPHGWVVRGENKELLNSVNSFFDKIVNKFFHRDLQNRYFKIERKVYRHKTQNAKAVGAISPYDKLIKKYAKKYGFDWRLIASQMFQESKFDNSAVSFSGATGLMQLIPQTAKMMGFSDISYPAYNIHAGVKYMAWIRKRFEDNLPVQEKMWMALASYNAGYGHLADARRLAAELGYDPNTWFENVEKAMLLLSKRKYARKARYGYCRGSEPVKYVEEIRRRYDGYIEIAE